MPVDHFTGATVTLYVPGYTLDRGYKIGNLAGDATIQTYDPVTQKAEVVWDYNSSIDDINSITLSTIFYDTSEDKRIVTVV